MAKYFEDDWENEERNNNEDNGDLDTDDVVLDKEVSSKMKLYRFMSLEEFLKMSVGITIKRYKTDRRFRTTSRDLCFLGKVTTFNIPYEDDEGKYYYEECKFGPENCLRFLQGIVSTDVLVEFQPTKYIEVFKRNWLVC